MEQADSKVITLTDSNRELNEKKKDGNAEFQRSVRIFKLQTNMNLVEKHATEISRKNFKAAKSQQQQQQSHASRERIQVIGSPTPDNRFGPQIRINQHQERQRAGDGNRKRQQYHPRPPNRTPNLREASLNSDIPVNTVSDPKMKQQEPSAGTNTKEKQKAGASNESSSVYMPVTQIFEERQQVFQQSNKIVKKADGAAVILTMKAAKGKPRKQGREGDSGRTDDANVGSNEAPRSSS